MCVCYSTGIEFRVTEEYDEDSPFSRPPSEQPTPSKQEPEPHTHQDKAESAPHTHPSDPNSVIPSGPAPSVNGAAVDSTGNGSAPARVSQPTATDESQSADSSPTESTPTLLDKMGKGQNPSVGRGQVYSDADTPERLPVGIEFAGQADADQPSSTAHMDPVQQKPGLRRTLDAKGHVAPDRDPEELGLMAPHKAQPPAPEGEGSAQGVAWWDSAAASVLHNLEAVRSAVTAGYESFTKGQSDAQQSGTQLATQSVL